MAKLNYEPRQWIRDIGFHNDDWKRCIITVHRRAGKTYATAAEQVKTIINMGKASDGSPINHLFYTLTQGQAKRNIFGIFETIAGDLIEELSEHKNSIKFKNGSTLYLAGQMMLERLRGSRFGSVVIDEYKDINMIDIIDVILPTLADLDGKLIITGTATYKNNFGSYDTFVKLSKLKGWLSACLGVNKTKVFSKERIEELKNEVLLFGEAQGLNEYDAMKIWNVEYECNFKDYEEGRPDMSAIFYKELDGLFNSGRITDEVSNIQDKVAIFDLASGNGRDNTCCFIVGNAYSEPIVYDVLWSNKDSLDTWRTKLKGLNVIEVVLPFDAQQKNRDTGLTTVDAFQSKGFKVKILKRLLKTEQVEQGRWLLEHAKVKTCCIPALREVGKLLEFSNKHALDQDIADAMMYTGQYLRRKDIKEVRRTQWDTWRKGNRADNSNGSDVFDVVSLPAFFN